MDKIEEKFSEISTSNNPNTNNDVINPKQKKNSVNSKLQEFQLIMKKINQIQNKTINKKFYPYSNNNFRQLNP